MKEKIYNRFQNLTSGIPIEGSVDGEVIENDVKSTSLVQKTSESIIEARVLMSQLIRGDDESKKLLLEYFREGIEEKYLQASIRTDQTRLDNLKKQMGMVDEGLSSMLGKETTITKVYKEVSEANSEQYQPILTSEGKFNPQGFFDFLRFHKELAVKILSASEIASEGAEIESQTALVPLRAELSRLIINEDQKTALELTNAKESLINAEIAKGEIRSSKIRGFTTPLIITVAEAPIILLQAPVDRLSKWMDEAQDKAVPIAAVVGATAGPILLFTKIATSSPIIEAWLSQHVVVGTFGGLFGGALLSVATWGTVKNILPAVKEAFDYTMEKVGNLKK